VEVARAKAAMVSRITRVFGFLAIFIVSIRRNRMV
jgi:hypothetical protein